MTTNDGSIVENTTDSDVVRKAGYVYGGTTGLVNDEEVRDGMSFNAAVQARLNIVKWKAAVYVSFDMGGLTPNKERTSEYRSSGNNYTTTFSANPLHIDSKSELGRVAYSGDGISLMTIGAGTVWRKSLTPSLLFGFGLNYSWTSSENKYTADVTYRKVTTVDDGDGIDEETDRTTTTTGSYTQDYTDTGIEHRFMIPIGLEYQATPNLAWRIGVIHVTSINSTESKWTKSSVSDLYQDVDRDDIAGNETDEDGITGSTGTTYIGNYAFDTTSRTDREARDYSEQYNYLYFGVGYTIDNTVQLDVLVTATNDYEVDAGSVRMSATYMH